MKKSKLLVVALIGLLMAGGLVLAGCKEPCYTAGGRCVVTWTSDGKRVESNSQSCLAFTCSSKCIVPKNWNSRKDASCDCD